MPQGTVKWFSAEKGYGFISRPDGDDVFVHFSAIEGEGYRNLEQRETVEFEVTQGPTRLQASKVRRLQPRAAPGPETHCTESVCRRGAAARQPTCGPRGR